MVGAWPNDDCPRGKVSYAGLVGVNYVAFFEIELEDLIGPCRDRVDDSGGAGLRLALLKAANAIAERGNGKDRVQPHSRKCLARRTRDPNRRSNHGFAEHWRQANVR